jgi:mono/diheme cytochrome c family protein
MRRFCATLAFASLFACRSTPPPAQEGTPVARGQATFRQQCAPCHYPDSQAKKAGPGLKSLFQRDKLSDGKAPTEANVRTRIERGGIGMPPFGDILTDLEKKDLIEYLKTL